MNVWYITSVMLKKVTFLLSAGCAPFLFLNVSRAEPPTDNLVIYYSFTGNALDSSIEKNDGVPSRAALTSDRFGSPNNAYRFNGTNSFIQAKRALPDSQSLTISLWLSLDSWVQLSNWSAPQVVFFEGDDSPGND